MRRFLSPLLIILSGGILAAQSSIDNCSTSRAFLGISQSRSSGDTPGIEVTVIRNSTAAEMGLQSGDKITAINGHPIMNWTDVTTAINMLEAGDPINVDFERHGTVTKGRAVIKSHGATYEQEEYYQEVEYAFLGINSNSISKTKAHKLGFDNAYGSYVSSVIPNSAAERARIQPFDYIYGVDQYRTGDGQSLSYILRKYEVGDRSTIHLVRRGQDYQAQVTFGSREDIRNVEEDKCKEPFLGVQSNNIYEQRTGINVDIVPNSTAPAIGLQNGDLITRINDYPMIDWDDIRTAVDNMEVGKTIHVAWIRNGREMHGSKAILSYCETITNKIIYQERPRNSSPDFAPRAPDKPDLRSLEVIISDLNREEADEMMRRYNVQLSQKNEIDMNSIKIVTHPEKGVFQLSFNLPNKAETVVRIFNNSGRSIYTYEMGIFSGQFSDEVDLSQNGIGTYYLQVQQGRKYAGKRLIVQHD